MLRGFIFLTFLALSLSISAADIPDAPAVNARAWLLIDHHSGRRLAFHKSDRRFTPTHLAKLMVAYIAFGILESGEVSSNTDVPISFKATRAAGPRMFASATSHVPIQNLIKAMIIGRANDATVALAEYIGSDEQAFVGIMNRAAENLGLNNTRFRDTTGNQRTRQYTDADDLATLVKAIVDKYPQYYRWFSEREFKYNGITLYSRNALLWRDKNIDGLIAVRSPRDGYHLIVSGKRDNMRLSAIVLGAPNERAMLTAGSELLKYGFTHYETRKLYTGNEGAVNLRVWLGDLDVLPVGLTSDLYVTLHRGDFENLQAKLKLTGTPFAPITRGQSMGSLKLILDDEIISEHDLVSLDNIGEGGFFSRMMDRAEMWLRDIPVSTPPIQTK